MAQSTPAHRGRKLNVTRIKSVIVLFTGVLTAFGSALTGIGAQVAFAPMLIWMFGFQNEKARATALRFAIFTALAALVGIFAAHLIPPGFAVHGVALTLGATVGAIVAAALVKRPRLRVYQTVGIAIGMFILARMTHVTAWELTGLARWNSVSAMLGIGVAVGALSYVLGLASGVLIVPSLVFLSGFTAQQSIAYALLVVALASLLPAWTYSRRGLMDKVYGSWANVGGLLGGLAGGLTLGHFSEKALLLMFALVAMFLSARELARTM